VLAAITLTAAGAAATVATSRGNQSMAVYAPAAHAPGAAAKPIVLVLSGEGGWRDFDDQLAGWLAKDGYWVGGIDCLKYFWKPQDDREAAARDVKKFADALVSASGSGKGARVVLAGYSFGADLAPWVAGAPGRPDHLAALLMIGPDLRGSTEARVTEILGFSHKDHTFDTGAALSDLSAIPVLFIQGGKDDSSAAPALAAAFRGPKILTVVPGATHHFAGHEVELRHAVLDGLRTLLSR
jgi:type IV secretory pathway VirJ component